MDDFLLKIPAIYIIHLGMLIPIVLYILRSGMLIPIVGAVGRIIWGTLGDKMSLQTLFVSGNVLSTLLQVRVC